MSNANSIADIRTDYRQRSLSEQDVKKDPFSQFNQWWEEVTHADISEPNAMTLATASADGMPDARIVLLKGFDENGYTFFTNYHSAKGQQLLENPRASVVFFWKELERQVRVSGLITMTSTKISDDYFNSRPEGSRIGAWASPQSEVISSREWLEENEKKTWEERSGTPLTRPEHWGGYLLRPVRVEFWQGRPNRLHDRILYTLQTSGSWKIERLAP